MYDKIRSLEELRKNNLNIHEYTIPESLKELIGAVEKYGKCTIRTDHKNLTGGLPFYIVKYKETNYKDLEDIWNECIQKNFKMIVSGGIKYDEIQEYNSVVNLKSDYTFTVEASPLKIPLRNMYKHSSSMTSVLGSLKEPVHWWEVLSNSTTVDLLKIKRLLWILHDKKLFNIYVECTKYPTPVGNLQEELIFWQIGSGAHKK